MHQSRKSGNFEENWNFGKETWINNWIFLSRNAGEDDINFYEIIRKERMHL